MPLSSPYGTLGYEPGVDVSSFPSGEMRGIRNGEAFSITPEQAGKYSTNFTQNGQQYTRLGMPLGDWFSANQFAKNSIKNLDQNNIGYIEDPTYGYAALSSAIDPVVDESSKIQSAANNKGFWNGPGPFMLAAMAFGGLPIATQMGAFGAGALGGAEGAGAIGSAGADTLAGGTTLADLGSPSFLQSFPGMSSPGLAGTPGLGTTIVDPAMAGIAGGAGGAAFDPSAYPSGETGAFDQYGSLGTGNNPGGFGYQPVDSAAYTAATGGQAVPGMIEQLISGLTSPKQLLSRLATSAAQQVGKSVSSNPVGTALSIGSGIYGLTEAKRQRELAERVAAGSDPFGPYRGQFAQQLAALGADPSGIVKTPGYKAGLQAVERRMASQGYNGSGNMMTALAEYGGNFYDREMTRLAGLSGANLNPAAAGSLALTGNAQASDLVSRSLASIGYGVGRGNDNNQLNQLIQLALMGAR